MTTQTDDAYRAAQEAYREPAGKLPIPADKERHPDGCPDAEWCRGNRLCYWDCRNAWIDW